MMIGILIDEGKLSLDTRLTELFPDITSRDKKFPLITVHHLLSMTAGVDFAEAGAVTEEKWTEAFFASTVRFTPGSEFLYNSMNTYILVRIAERVSGIPFGALADEKFFAPMGIRSYAWEIGPEGSEKGGWGLYMSPESWAKVGYMMMSGGVFCGRRILSEGWIALSSSYKATTPASLGAFNYGYQMWVAREGEEILFSGMLGQCVWLCPKNNIIVVMTGGNNELFAASPALEIVRGYLGVAIEDRINRRDYQLFREKERQFFRSRRWLIPKKRRSGLMYRLGFKKHEDGLAEWGELLGSYAFCSNNAGLMPLVLRTMQNSHGTGLGRISIQRSGEMLRVIFNDGDEQYSVLASVYGYEDNVLDFRGEKYRVKAMAGSIEKGEGVREYRLELIFSETSSVRRIRLIPEGDRLTVRLSETPNDRLLEKFIEDFSESSSAVSLAVDLLERRFGEDIIADMAKRTFNPCLVGISTSMPGYERILCEMDGAEEPAVIRLVRSLLERFFRDDEGRDGRTSNGGKQKK